MNFAIITLSDKGYRGEREDISGKKAEELVLAMGGTIYERIILPDEKELLQEKLHDYIKKVDFILTTGGTGVSPRDITPDVTLELIERRLPGFETAMMIAGLSKTPTAAISRAVCGISGKCVIIN